MRHEVKEKVVTPIKLCSFLDAQAAAVAFVCRRRVCVLLLELKRELEELAPHLPRLLHQFVAHSVVHNLEKPPFAASVGDAVQGLIADTLIVAVYVLKINEWNVDLRIIKMMVIVFHCFRPLNCWLDVSFRDCFYATFG